MDKKIKVLFVYGYGGSPESTFCRLIREEIEEGPCSDKFELLCFEYPQQDCKAAKEFLEDVIKRENINIIVGTSLGGFITLCLETDRRKVVINPCMMPSVELPLLTPRPDHPEDVAPSPEMIATYIPYEASVNSGEKAIKKKVRGLFGVEDELFGMKYYEPFKAVYGYVQKIPGGHHGNPDAILPIMEAIQGLRDPEHQNKRDRKRIERHKRRDSYYRSLACDPELFY